MIIGVDINNDRKAWGERFGMTHFVNPKDLGKDLVPHLVNMTKSGADQIGGADYTFDCTGNVTVMRQALEACHRGWGQSIIIGVAPAGAEISTRPFQLVTGRVWKGTAFGGARGRTDVPKIVDWYMQGKIQIDPMITHVMPLSRNQQRVRIDEARGIDPRRGDVLGRIAPSFFKRHCQPTGRAHAHPVIGSAWQAKTKLEKLMRLNFVTVDVFTTTQFAGNPLGVVLNAEGLSSEQMQTIAAEFNLAETTFVLPPKDPAHTAEVRIFTPRHEMPFAGHPNVGTAFALAREGKSYGRPVNGDSVIFEEKAGLVPISLLKDGVKISGARLASPQLLSVTERNPRRPRGARLLAVGGRYSDDKPPSLHRVLRRPVHSGRTRKP